MFIHLFLNLQSTFKNIYSSTSVNHCQVLPIHSIPHSNTVNLYSLYSTSINIYEPNTASINLCQPQFTSCKLLQPSSTFLNLNFFQPKPFSAFSNLCQLLSTSVNVYCIILTSSNCIGQSLPNHSLLPNCSNGKATTKITVLSLSLLFSLAS